MVECDSHIKLIPACTLDIYNVFDHIEMVDIVNVSCFYFLSSQYTK
jgi:hypothetical protein